MTIEAKIFDATLNTLHTYSEIYRNILDGDNTQATEKLRELIDDMITHLHTNCKGQVTNG